VLVLVAVITAALLVAAFGLDGSGGLDLDADALPNPMGGPVREAPGTSSGSLQLGGVEVADSVVAMGAVALGVTYVPGWDLVNPTPEDVLVTIGQPQVLEGCCPGPVYVDGDLIEMGAAVTVAAGGQVRVQFPLQMHPGMDGWHDLVVPLEAAGEQAVVRVTAGFTAEVTA
jgi:hypothetical protein